MNDERRYRGSFDHPTGILGFTAATATLPISRRIGDAQAAPAAPLNPSGIKALIR
jgi:hypothetical protein